MDQGQLLTNITRDPRYHRLVHERSRVAWALSAVVLALFMAFIVVIALHKDLLAVPIAGLVSTWGIPVGLGLILLAIAAIAFFTLLANRRWDPTMDAIIADASCGDAAR